MPHEFEVIEDAVLSALEPIKDLGVRTIDVYSGELDVPSAEIVAQITGRLPSVIVAVNGLEVEQRNRLDMLEADITMLVAARHLRGPNQAARGTVGSGPGMYDLLSAIRERLNAQQIVEGWSALNWTGDWRFLVAPKAALCLYTTGYQARKPARR